MQLKKTGECDDINSSTQFLTFLIVRNVLEIMRQIFTTSACFCKTISNFEIWSIWSDLEPSLCQIHELVQPPNYTSQRTNKTFVTRYSRSIFCDLIWPDTGLDLYLLSIRPRPLCCLLHLLRILLAKFVFVYDSSPMLLAGKAKVTILTFDPFLTWLVTF